MRLYVAGPMTGYPRWNFDAFEDGAGRLREAGYEVVSPHEFDLFGGFDPDAPVEEYTLADRVNALRRDVQELLTVDGVALLDGWEASKGAQLEVHIATELHLLVAPVEHFIDQASDVLSSEGDNK